MKILVADDDDLLRRAEGYQLEKEKWEVLSANDGEEVLNVVRKNKIDLVILDLLMPGLDGFEVLKVMKATPALMSIPVIVMSNLESDEDIKTAFSLGAIDYFDKANHSFGEVIEKIRQYFKEHEASIVAQEKEPVTVPVKPSRAEVVAAPQKIRKTRRSH